MISDCKCVTSVRSDLIIKVIFFSSFLPPVLEFVVVYSQSGTHLASFTRRLVFFLFFLFSGSSNLFRLMLGMCLSLNYICQDFQKIH